MQCDPLILLSPLAAPVPALEAPLLLCQANSPGRGCIALPALSSFIASFLPLGSRGGSGYFDQMGISLLPVCQGGHGPERSHKEQGKETK